MHTPSPNGPSGRDSRGRFAPGNPGGPGNPFARRTARLRSALLEAITEDDLRTIIAKLIEKAKEGDAAAIREVLDRSIGKPDRVRDPDRVELDGKKLEIDTRKAEFDELMPPMFG